MHANKLNQPNQGINCKVNTCYFYMQGDHCTAEKIEVAPKDASSSQETDCETFKPQTM